MREERRIARMNLHNQLAKLKTLQVGNEQKRQKLVREIQNLEHLINIVVDNEHKNVTVTPQGALAHTALRQRVNELYDKLSEYLKYQKSRERRIQDLEQKIQGRAKAFFHPEHTAKVLARIDELEKRHSFLRDHGLASPSDLDQIREKLDALRSKLL